MNEEKGYYERESRQHSAEICALCFLMVLGGAVLWGVSFVPAPVMAAAGMLFGLVVGSLCIISKQADTPVDSDDDENEEEEKG